MVNSFKKNTYTVKPIEFQGDKDERGEFGTSLRALKMSDTQRGHSPSQKRQTFIEETHN